MCRHCTHSPRCVELLCMCTRRKGHCEKVTAAAELTGSNRAAPPLKRLPPGHSSCFQRHVRRLPHTARRHRPNLRGKRFRDCACRKHSLMSYNCVDVASRTRGGVGVWRWMGAQQKARVVGQHPTLCTQSVCTHMHVPSHPLHCLLDVPTFLGGHRFDRQDQHRFDQGRWPDEERRGGPLDRSCLALQSNGHGMRLGCC
jgi:hypothetical protein